MSHAHGLEGEAAEINAGGNGVVSFVDVGSVGGLPSEWRHHAHRIRFLLNFEPRDQPLRTDHTLTLNVALWNETCTRDFYINQQQVGSSLLVPNFDYVGKNFEKLKQRGPPHLADT